MKNCFVVMPFEPQLHYTYLYLKRHIEEKFPGVVCQRGDDEVFTRPLLETLAEYIRQADVVIADCTGRNPNVFYELGMAHALDKPVILLSADDVAQAPADIRAFVFLRFAEGPQLFLEKLDRALRRVLGSEFDELYARASLLFDEFRAAKQLKVARCGKDDFSAAAAEIAARSGVPKPGDDKSVGELYLPAIIPPPADLKVMRKLAEWIEEKFGPPTAP